MTLDINYWYDIKDKTDAMNRIITNGVTEETFTKDNQDDLDLLESQLDLNLSDTILDFGCGMGRLMKPLSFKVSRIIGVDVSKAIIQYGQDYCREYNNIEFVCMPNERFLPNLMGVDKIYSVIALQHIPKFTVHFLISQLYELLNKGGIMCLQFPDLLQQKSEVLRGYYAAFNGLIDAVVPLMEFYTEVELVKWMEMYGLNDYFFVREKREDRLWLIIKKN